MLLSLEHSAKTSSIATITSIEIINNFTVTSNDGEVKAHSYTHIVQIKYQNWIGDYCD